MEHREKEDFILLTKKALSEADPERFVEVLLERESYIGLLLKGDPETLKEKTEECLLCETVILDRLEAEKNKVIGRIDKLSKSRRVPRNIHQNFRSRPCQLLSTRRAKFS